MLLQYIYIVIMYGIAFEWDEKKHSLNKRKRSTSFVEAQTIFADDNGLLLHIGAGGKHEKKNMIF